MRKDVQECQRVLKNVQRVFKNVQECIGTFRNVGRCFSNADEVSVRKPVLWQKDELSTVGQTVTRVTQQPWGVLLDIGQNCVIHRITETLPASPRCFTFSENKLWTHIATTPRIADACLHVVLVHLRRRGSASGTRVRLPPILDSGGYLSSQTLQ